MYYVERHVEVFRGRLADLRLRGSAIVSDGRIYGDVMLVCFVGVCTGWVLLFYILNMVMFYI
jgi:hypothetical protein